MLGYIGGMKIALAFAALTMLAACSKSDTAPGPGGVTMGEARALDKAAAMLDERRPPAATGEPTQAADAAAR